MRGLARRHNWRAMSALNRILEEPVDVCFGSKADIPQCPSNVRYGSEADIGACPRHVGFTPESRLRETLWRFTLSPSPPRKLTAPPLAARNGAESGRAARAAADAWRSQQTEHLQRYTCAWRRAARCILPPQGRARWRTGPDPWQSCRDPRRSACASW